MRTLRVPPGIESLSHGDEQYFPNEQGLVLVSDAAAEVLTRHPHNLDPVGEPDPDSSDGVAQPTGVTLSTDLTTAADAALEDKEG